MKLSLGNADAAKLQDAWHRAMLILNRGDSTFNGSWEYKDGVRGQVKAYEQLLADLDSMMKDNETWEVSDSWPSLQEPATWSQLVENTQQMMRAIIDAATRLGIDARTCEKLA